MDGRTRAVAILHCLFGGLGLSAGFAVVAAVTFPSPDRAGSHALDFLWVWFGYAGCVLVLQIVGGLGLLARQDWGRWLLIIVSAVLLLFVPIGTAIGGYSLSVLLSRASAKSVALKPFEVWERGKLLLVMMAVGVAIFGSIWIGLTIDRYTVRPSSQPVIGPNGLPVPLEALRRPATPGPWPQDWSSGGPAAYTIIFAILLACGLALASALARRRPRYRPSPEYKEFLRQRAARVAMLEADPVRRRYAPLVARGEQWSDEQIAYDLDPDAAVTCVHLRPIEQRMRAAAVRVRFNVAHSVIADCRVDADALKRRGLLVAPADYEEHYEPDRTPHDIPVAGLFCHACVGSRINVGHSDESRRYPRHFAG